MVDREECGDCSNALANANSRIDDLAERCGKFRLRAEKAEARVAELETAHSMRLEAGAAVAFGLLGMAESIRRTHLGLHPACYLIDKPLPPPNIWGDED